MRMILIYLAENIYFYCVYKKSMIKIAIEVRLSYPLYFAWIYYLFYVYKEEIYGNDRNIEDTSSISKVINDDEKMILASKASIIGVGRLAESAIIFYIYVYTRSENYLALKLKLNEKIKTEFDKAGIEIPYPQMDVHIKEFENKM